MQVVSQSVRTLIIVVVIYSLSELFSQGPTQPPIQWVLEGSFPGCKAAGA
jgi:hypothetical protein